MTGYRITLPPSPPPQSLRRDDYHGFNLVVVDITTGCQAYGANPLPRGGEGGEPRGRNSYCFQNAGHAHLSSDLVSDVPQGHYYPTFITLSGYPPLYADIQGNSLRCYNTKCTSLTPTLRTDQPSGFKGALGAHGARGRHSSR